MFWGAMVTLVALSVSGGYCQTDGGSDLVRARINGPYISFQCLGQDQDCDLGLFQLPLCNGMLGSHDDTDHILNDPPCAYHIGSNCEGCVCYAINCPNRAVTLERCLLNGMCVY